MKTVYILGAGFSKDAGLPLADGFFSVMKDVWLNLKPEHQTPAIQVSLAKALKFHADLNTQFSIPLPIRSDNIEDVFSLLAAESIGKNHRAGFDRFSMQNAIAYTLAIKTRDAYEAGSKIPQKYAEWLRVMLGHTDANDYGNTSIITFNYDDIIERSCNLLKVNYNIGLDLDNVNCKYYQGTDWSRKKENFEANARLVSNIDTNSLSLYKLHGSVRWLRQKDSAGLMIGDPVSLLTSEELTFDPVNHEIFIEPPTFGKSLIDPIIRFQWANAYKALMNAHKIIIVGYSFPKTDQHALYLLIAALRNNAVASECIIVNPDAETSDELTNIRTVLCETHFSNGIHMLGIKASEFFEDSQYRDIL